MITFGIVIFRMKYWESRSFQDLIKSYNVYDNKKEGLKICIFDNTDAKISSTKPDIDFGDGIEIIYHHDQGNPGIAAAMNYFGGVARSLDFKYFVFFDQDTSLPLDMYELYYLKSKNLEATGNCIAFPRIFANGVLISPSGYENYRTSVLNLGLRKAIELNNVTAINSGLMLKTDFFYKHNGFNNKLRIDFCDHDFIEKLNNKGIMAEIIDVNLEQDFSVNTNNVSQALFRYRLYLADMKVYRENKNKFLFLLMVDLPHLLKETYRHKSLEFLKLRLAK